MGLPPSQASDAGGVRTGTVEADRQCEALTGPAEGGAAARRRRRRVRTGHRGGWPPMSGRDRPGGGWRRCAPPAPARPDGAPWRPTADVRPGPARRRVAPLRAADAGASGRAPWRPTADVKP
jgi:hypothetical protein